MADSSSEADSLPEVDFTKMLFVAVHAGAGSHSEEKSAEYKALCRKACLRAMKRLREKASAVDAVTAAVTVLEDSELSNAGRGSNLTLTGHVECDASVMEGHDSLFGAVGAVSGVVNPVQLASRLLESQRSFAVLLGRVLPSVLVGSGAVDWARSEGFSCNDHHKLTTDNSKRLYRKYKRKVDRAERLNTANKAQCTHDISQASASESHGTRVNAEAKEDMKESLSSERDDFIDKSDLKSDVKDDSEGDRKVSQKRDETNNIQEDMKGSARSEVKGSTRSELEESARSEVKGSARLEVEGSVRSEVEGSVRLEVEGSVKLEVQGSVRLEVEGSMRSEVKGSARLEAEGSEVEGSARSEAEGSEAEGSEAEGIQDTVGAVCIDWHGNISAAVSSGGIWLKQPGRLGPAAMYGAGCWAQNADFAADLPGVAVITSGCGEHMMRTLLAKTCADRLSEHNATEGMDICFNYDFLRSPLLSTVKSRLAGAVAIRMTYSKEANVPPDVEVCWGHTTDSMAVGFMSGGAGERPKALISRLRAGSKAGRSFTMAGNNLSYS